MTVADLIQKEIFTPLVEGDALSTEITKVFCCDLLSIAMSRASAGCAWVTVMGNINTLAVASLTDTACIILAEGVQLDDAALKKAQEEQITVLQTDLPIFEAALAVHQLLV